MVPAAVAVVAYPERKLFADKLLEESQPANEDAVGAVVTEVTAVPPLLIASVADKSAAVEAVVALPDKAPLKVVAVKVDVDGL